ncbi:acyltransferase family protein [Paraglaciecola aquimarina]|uniref:Acyltransferase family protein n=1 Tax=Paraglaciecola aquimarina TaxID=1235557 RepID=A0ABU3T2D2_9ALTE|nr:acyltransferase family protein [Paraglaciecola aquimarina]MDU0356367.1 acyltransferase family protein [Paraglaciecola aquimarina]
MIASSSFTLALVFLTILALLAKELYYVFLPISALLLLNLSIADNAVSRMFEKDYFVWLGNISYSLYLWHWIIIQLANYTLFKDWFVITNTTDLLIYFFIVTIGSLVISHYSYLYIEKAGQNLVRKWM